MAAATRSTAAPASTSCAAARDDSYVVDDAGDTVDDQSFGGTGIDTVLSAIGFRLAVSAQVLGTIENLTLTGSAAVNGSGNAGNNEMTGNGAANVLDGSGGNDMLDGGAGAGLVVEVNTGGSLAADFAIRLTATTLASMTASDFVF